MLLLCSVSLSGGVFVHNFWEYSPLFPLQNKEAEQLETSGVCYPSLFVFAFTTFLSTITLLSATNFLSATILLSVARGAQTREIVSDLVLSNDRPAYAMYSTLP